ncbi:MAG: hypothetical protein MUO87_03645 [Thermoplasmata archaeon]|nr:hypothetical protein [Thermoplasmata archaeon]
MAAQNEVMGEGEAEVYVVQLLGVTGPMTTREIEVAASLEKRRCPDQTVLFLAKMRGKGLIEGAASIERKGWLWRLPGDAQTPLL